MSDGNKPIVVGEYYESQAEKQAFLRQVFDDTAKNYEAIAKWGWFNSGDWYRRMALRRAGLRAGMKTVDVAAGTGITARSPTWNARPGRTSCTVTPSRLWRLFGALMARKVPKVMWTGK